MHEHQGVVTERVAVGVGEGAGGGGADVGEDERGGGFRGQPGQVNTVPSGRGGREEAGRGAEGRVRGVVADAEAITIVRAAGILGEQSVWMHRD